MSVVLTTLSGVAVPSAAVGAGPVHAAQPRAPFVRCPVVAPSPPVPRPPRPTPPALDPAQREIGGPALATPGLVVPPGAPPVPGQLTATYWLVADLDSGAVLGGCGPHEYGAPASVQKLLLAATLLPRLDPKAVVQVGRPDLNFEPGSSAMGLLDGGRYRVDTLWLGLLLNSGNDAANVLARVGGGRAGVAGTIQAMNAQARRLGAYQTRAVTPSGLDGPGQFTSAYDLALIARECFARPDFRRYVATRRAQVPAQPPKDPRGFQIQNDNQLLLRYPGALGGKTGFTSLARHSFVGAAQRGGRRLVVALLGAEARPLRGWQQAAALLDWGFRLPRDAAVGHLVSPGELTPEPTRSAPPAAAGAAQPGGTGGPVRARAAGGFGLRAATGLAVAVAALPLVLLVALRRRRPRRRPARDDHPGPDDY